MPGGFDAAAAPGNRSAKATGARSNPREVGQHQESADGYVHVVARLCPRLRVIICRDGIQWILQRRDGERRGRARWAGLGYFRTREALLRVSRASCTGIDPAALAALAALPEHFGRLA